MLLRIVIALRIAITLHIATRQGYQIALKPAYIALGGVKMGFMGETIRGKFGRGDYTQKFKSNYCV